MSSILGTYLETLLADKGWSQRELARRADLNAGTVQSIISGSTKSPGLRAIIDMANALGVPEEYLMLAYKGINPEKAKEKHGDARLKELREKAEEMAALMRELES